MTADVYVTRKTKYRIVWERCPDCGRSNTERPGGCYIVERKRWVGWRTALTTYDRGGRKQAKHYQSIENALQALNSARAKKLPSRIVVMNDV